MNTEEKINNSIVEIDLINKEIKGYCKARDLKQQFDRLKEMD